MDSNRDHSRRRFLAGSAALFAGSILPACAATQTSENRDMTPDQPLFAISLAQWSLHRMLQSGNLDNLDFPAYSRQTFGIDAVEYVNQFFKDKARDAAYLAQLDRRAKDAGVTNLLIMIDGEGDIGHADEKERARSIDNHKPWADAARALGCHSIRVNAASSGTWEEQQQRAADGLSRLVAYAAPLGLNVIVENHGGLSSNGQWLAGVMKMVNHPRCGTLPDFGNFCFDWSKQGDPSAWYDRYKGVAEMMPFAKAVSAKSHDFDDAGNETKTDYRRMLRIVLDSGYRGRIGVEYEGDRLSEIEGTHATKRLLEKVREELADEFTA
ncbi:MAG: sugar phosphate isomerase/epimerase [Phycisphaerales bacterium]|nr:sugar phosphate isomerase/epimerase [Phycisphaerales bacterium]